MSFRRPAVSLALPLVASFFAAACAPARAPQSAAAPAREASVAKAPAAQKAPARGAPAPTAATVIDEKKLQAVLEKAVKNGLPGVALHVRAPNGVVFTATAGVSDRRSNEPMRGGDLFRVAANSKTFLAVVAVELAQEGKLDLDKSAAQWLPKDVVKHLANADKATVRQLLNHTSGVPEYLNDQFLLAALENPKREWSTREALEFAYDIDAESKPGAIWNYSNTNYLLVGMVIDAASGRHHSEEIRRRIIEPLKLSDTFYWKQQKITGRIAHGYVGAGSEAQDVTDLDFARGLADGAMVASVADMAKFVEAIGCVRDHALLTSQARDEIFRNLVPTDPGGYGLGVQVFEIGKNGEVAIGHGGTIVGYRSEMFYVPGSNVAVAIAANRSQPTEVFDEMVVEVLLALLGNE